MNVWSWLKLTICLWLLRKMIKVSGWVLLVALVLAAWPVTLVAAAGYGAAWLRGWPPVRLRRTAAWALIATGAWFAIQFARLHSWRPVALAPVHAWANGWAHLAAGNLARVFLLLVPSAVPAGLFLGRWRGRGGSTPSPPGWAGSWPPHPSPSTPASGNGRSAPPGA